MSSFETDVRASLKSHEQRLDSMERSVLKLADSISDFANQTNMLITQNARFEEKLDSMTQIKTMRLETLESAVKRIGDDVRTLQLSAHANEQSAKAKGTMTNNLFNYGWKIASVILPLFLGAYIFIGTKLTGV